MPDISKAIAFGTLTMSIGKKLVNKPEIPQFFRNMFVDDVSAAAGYAYDEVVSKRNVFEDDSETGEAEMFELAKSTDKVFSPPLYHKGVAYNAWDQYNRVAGADANIPTQNYQEFMRKVLDTVQDIKDGLDRTLELQCATAFQTGIVPLKHKTSIDFKPKATHKLAYDAGNNFSIDTVDPGPVFEKLAIAVIGDGLADPSVPLNVILGADVLYALQNNPFVKEREDIKRYDFGNLNTGTGSMIGAVPQGTVSYGSFKFRLFTYPALYLNKTTGIDTALMNPKGMLMYAEGTKLKMFYAGIPDPNDPDFMMKASKMGIYNVTDKTRFQKKIGIISRPVPIIEQMNKIAFALITQ